MGKACVQSRGFHEVARRLFFHSNTPGRNPGGGAALFLQWRVVFGATVFDPAVEAVFSMLVKVGGSAMGVQCGLIRVALVEEKDIGHFGGAIHIVDDIARLPARLFAQNAEVGDGFFSVPVAHGDADGKADLAHQEKVLSVSVDASFSIRLSRTCVHTVAAGGHRELKGGIPVSYSRFTLTANGSVPRIKLS